MKAVTIIVVSPRRARQSPSKYIIRKLKDVLVPGVIDSCVVILVTLLKNKLDTSHSNAQCDTFQFLPNSFYRTSWPSYQHVCVLYWCEWDVCERASVCVSVCV